MVAINTGYTNYYTNPTAVTSNPANFGPGQIGANQDQNQNNTQNAQAAVQATQTNTTPTAGYTTATRGSNLNISV